MLKSLKLGSFKGFEAASVPMEPFTLLVGPNGVGKTTILQSLDLLGGLVAETLPGYLEAHQWEYSDLVYLRARSQGMHLGAELDLPNRKKSLYWDVQLGARRYPGIRSEKVYQKDKGPNFLKRDGRKMERYDEAAEVIERISQTLTSSWLASLDLASDRRRFPALCDLARWARGIRGYFYLDPSRLRAPSRFDRVDIGPHGQYLAAFLGSLRRKNKPALDDVVARVRRYYPPLVALEPQRTAYGWTNLRVREKRNGDEVVLNARQISDGLLRLLAVSALFELPDKPSLLLLDEIENGLHPHLMSGFVGMLQDLVEEQGIQVIVTTHSPIALNFCRSPSSVVVLHRTRRGKIKIRTLDRAKGFDELRLAFDFGELWYNMGESWLTR